MFQVCGHVCRHVCGHTCGPICGPVCKPMPRTLLRWFVRRDLWEELVAVYRSMLHKASPHNASSGKRDRARYLQVMQTKDTVTKLWVHAVSHDQITGGGVWLRPILVWTHLMVPKPSAKHLNKLRQKNGGKIELAAWGEEVYRNLPVADVDPVRQRFSRGPRNGAFGKPCPCPRDTRHFHHFRRFKGFEQQSPCFTG